MMKSTKEILDALKDSFSEMKNLTVAMLLSTFLFTVILIMFYFFRITIMLVLTLLSLIVLLYYIKEYVVEKNKHKKAIDEIFNTFGYKFEEYNDDDLKL